MNQNAIRLHRRLIYLHYLDFDERLPYLLGLEIRNGLLVSLSLVQKCVAILGEVDFLVTILLVMTGTHKSKSTVLIVRLSIRKISFVV